MFARLLCNVCMLLVGACCVVCYVRYVSFFFLLSFLNCEIKSGSGESLSFGGAKHQPGAWPPRPPEAGTLSTGLEVQA